MCLWMLRDTAWLFVQLFSATVCALELVPTKHLIASRQLLLQAFARKVAYCLVVLGPMYTTQLYVQLFAVTVGANQLNAMLSGWRFLIGSRQRLLQPFVRKVVSCTEPLTWCSFLYIPRHNRAVWKNNKHACRRATLRETSVSWHHQGTLEPLVHQITIVVRDLRRAQN